MKKLFLMAALITSSVSFASPQCVTTTDAEQITGQLVIDTKVPKHLKGAVIIVRQADGKETIVPAEKFKVVPRKQQYLTTKTATDTVTMCKNETVVEKLVQADILRNRVAVGVGKGPKGGLKTTRSADRVTVETSTGVVGSLQYQRTLHHLFDDKLNVGAQIQTNKTIMGTVGTDF